MDIKNIITDRKYQLFLQGLYQGTIEQIKQQVLGDTVIDYPDIRNKLGISNETSQTIVEGLFDQEILERTQTGQTLTCPHDDSFHIRPRLFCPKCSSNDILKTDLIEHYKCGSINSEDEYIKDQELVCPKCNKTLHQIGVDYKKNPAFICKKCGNRISSPPIQFECKDFGHKFNVNEANIRELYTYTLTNKARTELEKLLFNYKPLINYFEELGFKVKSPLILAGFSGVKHQFDILGLRIRKERDSLLLKLVPTNYSLQVEEVQRIYGEIIDTQPDYAIIIALPDSTNDAKSFADITNITLVDGIKAEDVVQNLIDSNWTEKRLRYIGGENK